VGEVGGKWSLSSAAVSITSPVGGGRMIASAAEEGLCVGGAGPESQSLRVAVWAHLQLEHRGGEEDQKPGVALRLPLRGQVGFRHLCMEPVWFREQMGQVGPLAGHQGATRPKPQQFLHCLYLLDEYVRWTVLEREKSLLEDRIAGTSPGCEETTTEVAALPSFDCAFGLRYLAGRMRMSLELRINSARQGKSSSGSSGSKAMRREWIASWASLGAR